MKVRYGRLGFHAIRAALKPQCAISNSQTPNLQPSTLDALNPTPFDAHRTTHNPHHSSRCRNQHYRDTITQRCERCDGAENKSGGRHVIFIVAAVLVALALAIYFYLFHTKSGKDFYEAKKDQMMTYSNHATMLVITWQTIANLAAVHKFKVSQIIAW